MLEKERRKKEEEDRMKEKMQRMCTQRSVLHKNCKASAQQLSKAELNPPLLLQSLATMEGCKWTDKYRTSSGGKYRKYKYKKSYAGITNIWFTLLRRL